MTPDEKKELRTWAKRLYLVAAVVFMIALYFGAYGAEKAPPYWMMATLGSALGIGTTALATALK